MICGVIDGGDWLTAAHESNTDAKATKRRIFIGLYNTPYGLLKPYDARLMRCYPLSTRINHVANDDEACSAPVELAGIQSRLFF
jgi:hypothetical protein